MSAMRNRLMTALIFTLCFATSSFAAGLSDYIRAREFASRFTNVISVQGLTYTIGRNNADPARLTVVSGSRDAYIGGIGGRKIKLDRAAKVDIRGLLIPASALKLLGCSVAEKGKEILTTCNGKSYGLQRFVK
jgi:hypothetical protein